PLALKTSTSEKEKTSSVFHGSSTNIDDLKRHILMLQNLTQSDKNFQSKFVVFPSLQKNETERVGLVAPTTAPATASPLFVQNDQRSETVSDKEVTMNEPSGQVIADSTKMLGAYQFENSTTFSRMHETLEKSVARKFGHKSMASAKSTTTSINGRNIQTGPTTPHMKSSSITIKRKGFTVTASSVAIEKQRWDMNGSKLNYTPLPSVATTLKNEGKGIKQRKNGKRRGGKQTIRLNGANEQPKTVILNDDAMVLQIDGIERSTIDATRQETSDVRPTKPGRSSGSRKRSPSSRVRRNDNDAGGGGIQQGSYKQQKYAATGRLPVPTSREGRYEKRMVAAGSLELFGATTEQLTDEGSIENNNRSHNYRNRTLSADGNEKDVMDLNPDLCYTLSALSGGQQKLCAQHTSIMPAISRGARAAIQECKHQFRNRRWNCSIVNDDTVFGPVSNIGSPEMAFIYAMAAAGASSFIARACRDGQLASCGCSRSSRPSKLNEDWTWGGCGDDMEYGYKFTQTFIDIREKEKKRGTRGLVSIPAKYPKIIERLLHALNDSTKSGVMLNETDTILRPEDLEKLQDKIAKEIANSNLNPKEITDLQVRAYRLYLSPRLIAILTCLSISVRWVVFMARVERINKEITNSEVFNLKNVNIYDKLKKIFRKPEKTLNGVQFSASAKARALMNLHNNEAGRRAVIKKSRIICKCHGVSGSCSLITCWQQLTSIREIGDFLREKYDEATQVKINKRGRLQVKDPRYKIPSALDLIYLDESPDWCRVNRQLMWQGTHGRVCSKTSSGLDGCSILCCGRGYNTKKIIVKERCNCKFQWCCQVKCEICTRTIEEYTCK
ncbi:AGAP010290-PA, partial [Anopheles gambiae str. PEST]